MKISWWCLLLLFLFVIQWIILKSAWTCSCLHELRNCMVKMLNNKRGRGRDKERGREWELKKSSEEKTILLEQYFHHQLLLHLEFLVVELFFLLFLKNFIIYPFLPIVYCSLLLSSWKDDLCREILKESSLIQLESKFVYLNCFNQLFSMFELRSGTIIIVESKIAS